MILGALGMILARKPVHSALCLAAVMISLAVQYAAQDAPFLFAVQIIVYTGAILMLFLFVLMLVGVDAADSMVETIKGQRPLAVLAGLGLRLAAGLRRRQRASSADPIGLDCANRRARRQHPGHRRAGLQPLRVRLRGHLGAADHRRRRARWCWPTGSGWCKQKTQADLATERMRRYAETGQHPGPLPTPGVFARHNAVDTPALLPDGTASELSVSADPAGPRHDPGRPDLAAPIEHTLQEIDGPDRRRTTRRATRPATTGSPRRRRSDSRESRLLHRAVGDPVHHRRGRLHGAAQRHRRLHVRRADAERLQPGPGHLLPACTASWTVRSPPSS